MMRTRGEHSENRPRDRTTHMVTVQDRVRLESPSPLHPGIAMSNLYVTIGDAVGRTIAGASRSAGATVMLGLELPEPLDLTLGIRSRVGAEHGDRLDRTTGEDEHRSMHR